MEFTRLWGVCKHENKFLKCDFTQSKTATQMFLAYATSSFCHTPLCMCVKVRLLYFLNTRPSSPFRAAQSAPSPHLHRVCVHSATSGCVTSAQMCISIRELTWLPSMSTCTNNRNPLPPSVLTCTRGAPAPCLPLDKARLAQILHENSDASMTGC